MKKGLNKSGLLLIAGITMITGAATAQKKAETDAALAYRSIKTAMESQDMEGAKKATLKAKGFIDQAAAHAETEKSPKTLFYKGEIYGTIHFLRQLNDQAFNDATPSDALDQAIKAYNSAYTTSDKFDSDIANSIGMGKMQIAMAANALFDGQKFKEAGDMYETSAKLSSALNEIDTAAIYNTALCATNSEDWDRAAANYRRCAELNYKPETIFRSTASAYISAKKNEEALTFLKEAIVKSPKDKYLYWTLGTIAMDLNDNQLVIDNLNKAIELDPKYADAYYNLGSYFLGKGEDLRQKAAGMTASEKKQSDEMLNQSLEFYKLSTAALEQYVILVPNDKDVLKSLYKMFRSLKDTEKEAKYKKMMEEADQKISLENFSKLSDGMSFDSVQKILGNGSLTSSSGNVEVYTWSNSSKIITVTFTDKKLSAKSQNGL